MPLLLWPLISRSTLVRSAWANCPSNWLAQSRVHRPLASKTSFVEALCYSMVSTMTDGLDSLRRAAQLASENRLHRECMSKQKLRHGDIGRLTGSKCVNNHFAETPAGSYTHQQMKKNNAHLNSSSMLFSGARPTQARKIFSNIARCFAKAFTHGVPLGTSGAFVRYDKSTAIG